MVVPLSDLFLMALAGIGLVALVDAFPNTFGKPFVRSIQQHHTRGAPTKVTPEMTKIIQDVCSDNDLSFLDVDLLTVFVGVQTEAKSWGGMNSISGVSLAYPAHFHYHDPEDVKLSRMVSVGKHLNINNSTQVLSIIIRN